MGTWGEEINKGHEEEKEKQEKEEEEMKEREKEVDKKFNTKEKSH